MLSTAGALRLGREGMSACRATLKGVRWGGTGIKTKLGIGLRWHNEEIEVQPGRAP